MKKVHEYKYEKYIYDTLEEREKHVKTMCKKGYHESGKKKEFTGKLLIDDVSDIKNYIIIAEFYKY